MAVGRKRNYEKLKDKWIKKHEELSADLFTKHRESLDWLSKNTKQIAATSLGSLILLASPGSPTLRLPDTKAQTCTIKLDIKIFLISTLKKFNYNFLSGTSGFDYPAG